MRRKPNIALKKQAKQQRSIATVAAIVEAATYILRDDGPSGFTANKVAERAGVNIASFYQYFPNKEALLFHIAQLTWDKQMAELSPILTANGPSYASKLRGFMRAFFAGEAAEADLRQALRIASIDLKETAEYQKLIADGTKVTTDFFRQALREGADDLDFTVKSIGLLMMSFAERATDERDPETDLILRADLLSEMLIAHFKIA